MQNLSKYGSKKCEFCQESVDFNNELRQKNVNHDCGKNCEYRGKKSKEFSQNLLYWDKNFRTGILLQMLKKNCKMRSNKNRIKIQRKKIDYIALKDKHCFYKYVEK